MDKIRKIIREEFQKVMKEIGEEDPVKVAQDMIKSNEEQVKQLKDELKFREADARVSNLPRDEKDARTSRAKMVKDRLEMAEKELELAQQSLVNATQYQTMQQSQDSQQNSTIQSQT